MWSSLAGLLLGHLPTEGRGLASASLAVGSASGAGRTVVAGPACFRIEAHELQRPSGGGTTWFSGEGLEQEEQAPAVEQVQRLVYEVAQRIAQTGRLDMWGQTCKLLLGGRVHVPLRRKMYARYAPPRAGVKGASAAAYWSQSLTAKLDPVLVFEHGFACGAVTATGGAASPLNAAVALLAELYVASEGSLEHSRGESADLADPDSLFRVEKDRLLDAVLSAQGALRAALGASALNPGRDPLGVSRGAPSGAAAELQRATERLQPSVRAASGASESPVDLGERARLAWISDGLVVPSTELAMVWGRTRQALDQAVKRGELFSISIRNRKWYLAVFKELAASDVAKVCRELHRLSDAEQLVFWLRPHGALGGATVGGAFRSRRIGDVIALAKVFAEGLGAPHAPTQPLDDSKT